MVIDDGDFGGTGVGPSEDDAPLVIDADGVEAREAALEGFEAIAGRDGHVGEFPRLVELDELAKGHSDKSTPSTAFLGGEETFGFPASEGLNHELKRL